MSAIGKDKHGAVRIACSARRESGSCQNGKTYRMDRIEAAVIRGMQSAINRPEGLEAWLAEWQADARKEGAARARTQRALEGARARLDRLSRHLIDGRVDEAFFDREAPPIRAEIANIEARLAEAPAPDVLVLHPVVVAEYANALRQLGTIAGRITPQDQPELVQMFRALVARVVLIDTPDGGYDVEVFGPLTPLLRRQRVHPWGRVVAEDRLIRSPKIVWGRWPVRKSAEIRRSSVASAD